MYAPSSLDVQTDVVEAVMRRYPIEEEPPNVGGYIDYITDRKSGVSLDFRKIKYFPNPGGSRLRIGILEAMREPAPFDLVADGEVLISRGETIVDLHIPQIRFSNAQDRVTPKMVTDSLIWTARYIQENVEEAEYVTGIAHPRIAKVATQRWGFNTSEKPFPQEVSEVLEITAEEFPNSDSASLQNEVLVYQSREAFLERFLHD